MASRWAQRESSQPSSWRQALLFNSLLLLLPILAARIIAAAYTTDIASDPMSVEARAETRVQIDRAFGNLIPNNTDARDFWAARISQTLRERDFAAARGYLLAAPLMLDRRDAQAVLAAAQAEEAGTEDQRLARAALLFLPDDLRAKYERAIEPPKVDASTMPDRITNSDVRMINELPRPAETQPDAAQTDPYAAGDAAEVTSNPQLSSTPFSARKDFFLLGDPEDLTRRTQLWLTGNAVNDVQLRLRALGLQKEAEDTPKSRAFANAASILVAAHRAGRLDARFSQYIESRIEDALPVAPLRTALEASNAKVATTSDRAETFMAIYASATRPEALSRLSRDMETVARLAELTSSAGAITLLENTSSPEDMRRILLVTEASGERAVALSRELGPKTLGLAQIGVKWTRNLILQVMGLMALGMALIWTTLSAFTQAETLRTKKRR